MSEAVAVSNNSGPIDFFPKKTGRPSKFTVEIAQEICERLANGEPLAVICRDPRMPGVTSVWNWEKLYPDLSEAIARARETGADVIAWNARATARGGGESTEDVQRDRLIIETDLKLLAKWNPRYSDRQRIEHTGADGGAIQVEHTEVLQLDDMDYEAREKMREALEAMRASRAVNVTSSSDDGA